MAHGWEPPASPRPGARPSRLQAVTASGRTMRSAATAAIGILNAIESTAITTIEIMANEDYKPDHCIRGSGYYVQPIAASKEHHQLHQWLQQRPRSALDSEAQGQGSGRWSSGADRPATQRITFGARGTERTSMTRKLPRTWRTALGHVTSVLPTLPRHVGGQRPYNDSVTCMRIAGVRANGADTATEMWQWRSGAAAGTQQGDGSRRRSAVRTSAVCGIRPCPLGFCATA